MLALAVAPVCAVWSFPNDGASFVPLGVQQCNTRCQTAYTDCLDRCDGVKACQDSCTRNVNECVNGCTNPAPKDSASPSAPNPPASSAPAPTAPPKGGKGKPAPAKPAKPNGSH